MLSMPTETRSTLMSVSVMSRLNTATSRTTGTRSQNAYERPPPADSGGSVVTTVCTLCDTGRDGTGEHQVSVACPLAVGILSQLVDPANHLYFLGKGKHGICLGMSKNSEQDIEKGNVDYEM